MEAMYFTYEKQNYENRRCNICSKVLPLTEDHVPPKCCSNKGNIRFYSLFDKNLFPNKKPKQAQNGIKFKTICAQCNNERLGHELDPALGEFQEHVIEQVSRCTSIADTLPFDIKINHICRAVVGHLLAAFPDYIDTDIENQLREYFFDKSKASICGQHLYVWINCEKRIGIARNIGIANDPIIRNCIVSLLKFPGLAFMLCNRSVDDNLVDLFEYTTTNFDDIVEFPLNISSIISKSGELRITEWPLIENEERLFVQSSSDRHRPIFTTLINL